MEKRHRAAGGERLLAALVIVLALIVLANLAFNYKEYIGPGRAGTASSSARFAPGAAPSSPPPPDEVLRLDYLYAGWCSYCTLTTPTVQGVALRLGPAASLRTYDEALRAGDPQVKALYDDYKARHLFVLFPTLVAHGQRGDRAIGGLQTNETALLGWVCGQYTRPPAACKQ